MDKPFIEEISLYKGFRYVILFQPMGYRCGYVRVPRYHSLFEVPYDGIDIKCHGGLTYSSHELLGEDYHGWWIGFDCAHAGDVRDVGTKRKYYGDYVVDNYSSYGTVKDLDFCITECKNIIDQLIEKEIACRL